MTEPTDRDNFASNVWTQCQYDIRDIIFPREPKGSAPIRKSILFVIGAAGIPSQTHRKAGYDRRNEILAQQVGIGLKALKGHLTFLEDSQFLISKFQGKGMPRKRSVDYAEIHRVTVLQKKDFKTWQAISNGEEEDLSRPLWTPVNYHFRTSNPWTGVSSTSIVTPIDTPIGTPIGAPLDTSLVTPIDEKEIGDEPMDLSVTLESKEKPNTSCSPPHPVEEPCQECWQIEDY